MAAAYTGFSTKTIERWINSGKLPFVQIDGGHRRIDRVDLDRLMESNKIDFNKNQNQIINSLGGKNNAKRKRFTAE